MPKQLTRSIYKCIFCEKEFPDESLASRHERLNHNIIYVPIEASDLQGLINFIVTNDKNQELITERLMKTLFQYTKA